MAFDKSALVKIGGQNQAQSIFTYTSDDDQAVVLAPGYFNGAIGTLRQYDYIFIRNGVEDYYVGVNSQTLPITINFFNTMQANSITGFADYVDTQYTEVSPIRVDVGPAAALPNNAGNTVDSQKPMDIATFYDGTAITGRNGDGILITIDFKAKPASAGATELTVFIDITGGTGTPAPLARLYPRLITFNKGAGVEKDVNFTIAGYTLGTWEANGGVVKISTNGPFDLYDIRYVLTRTHKAR